MSNESITNTVDQIKDWIKEQAGTFATGSYGNITTLKRGFEAGANAMYSHLQPKIAELENRCESYDELLRTANAERAKYRLELESKEPAPTEDWEKEFDGLFTNEYPKGNVEFLKNWIKQHVPMRQLKRTVVLDESQSLSQLIEQVKARCKSLPGPDNQNYYMGWQDALNMLKKVMNDERSVATVDPQGGEADQHTLKTLIQSEIDHWQSMIIKEVPGITSQASDYISAYSQVLKWMDGK